MALQLLETRDSVLVALATMNPVAREAAQLFAHRLFENPSLLEDKDAFCGECSIACAAALERNGVDVRANPEAFRGFIAECGGSVLNVGTSIVHVTYRDHQRKEAWGKVGKVAAAAVGVALGVWFS